MTTGFEPWSFVNTVVTAALPNEPQPLPYIFIISFNGLSYPLFLKYVPILASFCLFSSFTYSNINHIFNNVNWKSIDGVLGIRTQSHMMICAIGTTELWPLWITQKCLQSFL